MLTMKAAPVLPAVVTVSPRGGTLVVVVVRLRMVLGRRALEQHFHSLGLRLTHARR
jgi:hypothetical protein